LQTCIGAASHAVWWRDSYVTRDVTRAKAEIICIMRRPLNCCRLFCGGAATWKFWTSLCKLYFTCAAGRL